MPRTSYLVIVETEPDGKVLHLRVPQLGDVSTTALDLLEGEVLIRQAISIATNLTDSAAFDIDMVEEAAGL